MRLNTNHRETLRRFVNQKITGSVSLIKKRDSAYQTAANSLLAAFGKKFPDSEIAVLTKYELSERDDCVRIKTGEGSGDVEEFSFHTGTGPVLPVCQNCYNSGRIFDFGDKIGANVTKWRASEDALEADCNARREAYHSLIFGASTDTEILKVWPESKEVFDKFNSNLPAQLTESHLAKIRADMAERSTVA